MIVRPRGVSLRPKDLSYEFNAVRPGWGSYKHKPTGFIQVFSWGEKRRSFDEAVRRAMIRLDERVKAASS